MATDIELVIKIPDILMEYIVKGRDLSEEQNDEMAYAIADGIPLPKGHGRLIDISKIHKAIPAEEDNLTGQGMTSDEMDAYNDGIDAMWNLVQRAETIIEAERSNEE